MSLQNRVDPWGNIVYSPARGTFMGNRGILHNKEKQITKTHQHQNWVTCKLSYKGRQRKLMSPSNYTELFFLDEATAFAAGHRPCSECRRERYIEFKKCWIKANFTEKAIAVSASAINKIMHRERINRRKKVTYRARLKDIPNGTFFSRGEIAYVICNNTQHRWTFDGYHQEDQLDSFEEVDILTPESIVKTFKLGFLPTFHESITLGID